MSHILSNFYQANFTPHKKVSCQSFATFRIPSVFLHDLFCFVIVSLPSKSFIHGNLLPHRSVLQPERIRTLSHWDKAHLFIMSSATLISLNVIQLKLENAVLPGNPFQLCKHGVSEDRHFINSIIGAPSAADGLLKAASFPFFRIILFASYIISDRLPVLTALFWRYCFQYSIKNMAEPSGNDGPAILCSQRTVTLLCLFQISDCLYTSSTRNTTGLSVFTPFTFT